MRFPPIGFGGGKIGEIGPHSRRGSIESSASDGTSSDADIEMSEAPPLSSKPAKSTKSDGTSPKKHGSKGSTNIDDRPSKRKHTETGGTKGHNSSFIMPTSTIDNTELKEHKKQQTKSQRATADNLSLSTEASRSYTSISPLRTLSSLYSFNNTESAPHASLDSEILPPPFSASGTGIGRLSLSSLRLLRREHNLIETHSASFAHQRI